jgi:hypothetical protein
LIDGRYGHAQKVHSGIREWLYTRRERDDEDVRAPQLANEIKEFGVGVDPGHIWSTTRPPCTICASVWPTFKTPTPLNVVTWSASWHNNGWRFNIASI